MHTTEGFAPHRSFSFRRCLIQSRFSRVLYPTRRVQTTGYTNYLEKINGFHLIIKCLIPETAENIRVKYYVNSINCYIFIYYYFIINV